MSLYSYVSKQKNLCVFLVNLIQQICVFPIPTLLHTPFLHTSMLLYLYIFIPLSFRIHV